MQLTLALPHTKQPKPRLDTDRAAFLAMHSRKAALAHRLRNPKDLLAARLAVSIFEHGHEISDINECLRQSAAARRWLAACFKAGIVCFRICPYFGKRIWRAR